MPAAPSYKWEETESTVIVMVCRRGLPRGNHDMLSTDVLLKVSASPYLLLLDLFEKVDSAATTATVSETHITFTLQKRVPGVWGRLTAQGSKADLVRRREASMEAAYDRLRQADAARAESRRKAAGERVDQKYEKIERGMDADIAAHDARMARTKQDVSQWKSTALQPDPPASNDHVAAQRQQKARSAARDPGSEDSSDSDNEPLAADHPDYHGRGWQPSKVQPKPKQTSAGTAAAAAPAANADGTWWDAISSDSSDSDDEGSSRQPLKELSTRREQAPAAEPQEPPPPPKPAPRSSLPSIKIEFTDIQKAPGIPARTKLPNEEPKAAPPKEKKLELPLLSRMS